MDCIYWKVVGGDSKREIQNLMKDFIKFMLASVHYWPLEESKGNQEHLVRLGKGGESH